MAETKGRTNAETNGKTNAGTKLGRRRLLESRRLEAVRLDSESSSGAGSDRAHWGRVVPRIRAASRWPSTRARTVVGVLATIIVMSAAAQGAAKDSSGAVRYGLSTVNTLAIMALSMVTLGRWVRVRPGTFRRIAFVSAGLLGFIILTGAAVRLTGSGLGCIDWPTCNNGSITPELSDMHGLIEFGNRIVTGLCVFAAGVGVLATLVRVPYRPDLLRPAVVVVVAIMGNAVLGGLMVQKALPPTWVLSHFLLAIVALAAGIVLLHRSGEQLPTQGLWGRTRVAAFGVVESWLGRALTFAALLTLFLGTIVTGSGPHAGDEAAERLGYAMITVARLHSLAAWSALACVAALAWRSTRLADAHELRRRVTVLLVVVLLQGGVGYLQWFTQVPAGLVFVHIIGAVAFWSAVLWVRAALTVPPSADVRRSGSGIAPSRPATV
jgi:heme a synthase